MPTGTGAIRERVRQSARCLALANAADARPSPWRDWSGETPEVRRGHQAATSPHQCDRPPATSGSEARWRLPSGCLPAVPSFAGLQSRFGTVRPDRTSGYVHRRRFQPTPRLPCSARLRRSLLVPPVPLQTKAPTSSRHGCRCRPTTHSVSRCRVPRQTPSRRDTGGQLPARPTPHPLAGLWSLGEGRTNWMSRVSTAPGRRSAGP